MLNPPIRSAGEPTGPRRRVPRREWLTPRLLAVLAVSTAATLVLGGTDVAVVAVLRASGDVGWTGAVLAGWAVASLVGGFAYGAVTGRFSPLALMAALSLCTIPVGLGGAHWWLLCLALIPAGALCAPTIAATSDAVSRLAPAEVRGEAMGLHGSAVTVGIAVGAPLAGAVIDASAPAWGFVVTGALGALVALVVLPVELRRRRSAAAGRRLRRPPPPAPDADLSPRHPLTVRSGPGSPPRASAGAVPSSPRRRRDRASRWPASATADRHMSSVSAIRLSGSITNAASQVSHTHEPGTRSARGRPPGRTVAGPQRRVPDRPRADTDQATAATRAGVGGSRRQRTASDGDGRRSARRSGGAAPVVRGAAEAERVSSGRRCWRCPRW